MNRIALSRAAAGLLRALIRRSQLPRDRILLIDWHSVDWQSLTFIGERHVLSLRLTGADAQAAMDRLCVGIEDAEFEVPGQLVADIACAAPPECSADGSLTVTLEALTVVE